MKKIVKSVLVVAAACLSMLPAHLILAGETGGHAPQVKGEPESVRTLEGYVEQEKEFHEFLKKNHPLFKYEKAGKVIGKYQVSDREEEFVEFGGGKDYAKKVNMQTAMTYRLGMESILDLPNRFVGAKKCGECHPAQYEKWSRSRHAVVVRFPDEMVELPGKDLKAPLYGSKDVSILPKGITPDVVYAVIGTPRTKYGFLDAWLVRGTYHIEDGLLRDLTGTLVAGGNQHSRHWAETLTPDMAKKIAEFVPGFPTKLADFGDNGSSVWGMTSYGAKYKKNFLFQPASSYCEVCHSFKFDFKNQQELFAALGNPAELRKHTVNKGITCEECHGAGAHLVGARGAGMPSNCERCHQRFAFNEDEAKKDPKHQLSSYFKSACPSCGTEGSQSYYTKHGEKGMRCGTCHDPHEVTQNDWRDSYTEPALKKQCQDCHSAQAGFFANNPSHGTHKCSSCHMPVMMSCENFGTIQFPDKAGFDNTRAAHIWKINVSPDEKTLNPPEGKGRDFKGAWRLTKKDGRPYIDLMWSCGRTSFSDGNLLHAGGCHSGAQSQLPKNLHFTDQKQVFNVVEGWQRPVKESVKGLKANFARLDPQLASSAIPQAQKGQIQVMLNQAKDIVTAIEKDGSWGVHAPDYTLKKVREAETLASGAKASLDGSKASLK
jgi:hypothetical protein